MTLYFILAALLAVFVAACMFAVHTNTILRKENMELGHKVFQKEHEIENLERECRVIRETVQDFSNSLVPVSASYVVTESDSNKYLSDGDIRRAVRSRLAHSIAWSIMKQMGDAEVSSGENGHDIYSYRLLVKKED